MGRKGTKKIQEGLGLPNIFRKTFTLCNKKYGFYSKKKKIKFDNRRFFPLNFYFC